MALVAYENSDSSEYEDEGNEAPTATAIILNKKDDPVPSVSKPIIQEKAESQSESLFNLLPQPTNKTPAVLEEDDEFLHKKETDIPVKPKAKITVPSLSDFRDVEDAVPAVKPKKMNGKKSGLLSMLPQPRNAVQATTKSLIPHVLTQKPKPSIPTAKKKLPLPPIKKNKTDSLAMDYSDDSDDEVQNDFFSINKPVKLPEDMALDIDDKVTSREEIQNVNIPKQPRDMQSYFKANTVENEVQSEYSVTNGAEYESASYGNGNTDQSSSSSALDEEAILKLCGTRGKRKREDIQIVDVDQSEVLAEARERIARGLVEDTSQRVSSSKRRGNEPTSQQKRKHQITYLAHQAKANEAELQNQWANNRMSKRQTQSKYGF